jgi:hypothetical protein
MADEAFSKRKSRKSPLLWVPLAEQVKRFRRRLAKDPKLAEVQPRAIIDAFCRELQKGPSKIRHRIAGMDPKGLLPNYFEGNEINSEDPFVTADLLYAPKDWADGTVILPSRERRPIMVCGQDSEQWFQDEVRAYLARQQKTPSALQPTFHISPNISPHITANNAPGTSVPPGALELGARQEPAADADPSASEQATEAAAVPEQKQAAEVAGTILEAERGAHQTAVAKLETAMRDAKVRGRKEDIITRALMPGLRVDKTTARTLYLTLATDVRFPRGPGRYRSGEEESVRKICHDWVKAHQSAGQLQT